MNALAHSTTTAGWLTQYDDKEEGKKPLWCIAWPAKNNLKLVSENDFLLAAYQGDLEKVKSLIDDGHNVSEQNFRDQSALHFAAISGNPELVKLLLDAGL